MSGGPEDHGGNWEKKAPLRWGCFGGCFLFSHETPPHPQNQHFQGKQPPHCPPQENVKKNKNGSSIGTELTKRSCCGESDFGWLVRQFQSSNREVTYSINRYENLLCPSMKICDLFCTKVQQRQISHLRWFGWCVRHFQP